MTLRQFQKRKRTWSQGFVMVASALYVGLRIVDVTRLRFSLMKEAQEGSAILGVAQRGRPAPPEPSASREPPTAASDGGATAPDDDGAAALAPATGPTSGTEQHEPGAPQPQQTGGGGEEPAET